MRALGAAGTNAQAALPAILELLHGTNRPSWSAVPETVQRIGASNDVVLPRLKEQLKTLRDDEARALIGEIILNLAPADREAQSVLVDLINRKSPAQLRAIVALGEAGPSARDAVPALRRAQKSEDPDVRRAAAEALRKIQRKSAAR